MKTRLLVAIGSGMLALLLLVVGLVLQNQANFSHHYVQTQLGEHHITFTPIAGLQADQKKVPCLAANANKQLTTGKQAECYALNQIGLDLLKIDNGKGYAQDHYAAYLLQLKTQAAVQRQPQAPATQALVKQSAVLTQKADQLFYGETMRGLLLSAYGFSLLGDRAGQAALVCLIAAAIFFAVLIGALVLPRTRRRTSTHAPIENVALRTAENSPGPSTEPTRDSQGLSIGTR
jgi:hypothetical protein